jgi:hypothetical protein
MNEMYEFIDGLTSTFQPSASFQLEFTREPHRITFETDDILMYFENSWLVNTYDFFILDGDTGFSISESEVSIDEVTKIKEYISSAVQRMTGSGALALYKGKAEVLLNKIAQLRKETEEKLNAFPENVSIKEKKEDEKDKIDSRSSDQQIKETSNSGDQE